MFEFTNTEIPTTTREAKHAQFYPLIQDMLDNGGARQVVADYKTDDHIKVVSSLVSGVQRAAADQGYTARKRVDVDGKGKATVTFWLVDQIKRPRSQA